MKTFMKKIFKGLAAVLLAVLSVGAIGQSLAYATTLQFVQTPTIALYSSLSSVATTMRITPYPVDLNGVKLTMTDFGSSPTVTVDPKLRNYEEIIGFTGITDNGDNTATLTGLSRNLVSKSPYTTTGTGKSHSASALVVFSNNPQMYARFAALENTQSITGIWTFTTTPTITNAPSANTDAANKAYVDGVAVAGASNANTTTKGIVEIATKLETASSTPTGSTGATLGIPASSATSTYNAGLAGGSGLNIVVTQNNNTIDPNFISTSSNYTWGGTNTYSKTMIGAISSTTYSGSTVNIDWSAGQSANVLINQSSTVTFTNVTAATSIRVFMCQDGTGSRTVSSWPTSMRWQTGFAPTLTTTANKCDIISLVTATSTTSVFGAASANF